MGLIFNGNGDVIKAVDGSLTVEGLDLGGSTNINAGIGTFSGNLNVGGVLTYEDVKNVDSVGVVTARDGIRVTSGDILLTGGDGRKISFASDGTSHYFKMDNSFNGPVINGYGGIKFETYGTNERLRIESSGRVGINTTDARVNGVHIYDKHLAVTQGYPLTWLQPYSSTSRGRMTVDSGGNYLFQFGSGNDEKIRFKSDGKVGIGTASPARIIHAWEPSSNNLLFLESGNTNCDVIQADTGGSTRLRSTQGAFYLYTNGDANSNSAANSDLAFRIDADKDVHVYDDLFIPDKIIHEGDTNTAIRFPDADTVSVETAGTERLNITASAISASTMFKADSFEANANLVLNSDSNANNSTNDSIIFKNAGTERVRIKGTGYVGIGTASPQERLHLYGGNCALEVDAPANRYCSVGFSVDGASKWWMGRGDSDILSETSFFIGKDAGSAVDKGGNSAKFVIDTNGKVGIGSVTPGATLDLQSADTEVLLRLNTKPVKNGYLDIVSDANRRGVIRFQDTGGTTRWSIGNGDSDELTNTSFHISSGSSGGGAAKFVINSSGKIGIGIATPDSKLHLEGSDDTAKIKFQRTGTTIGGSIQTRNESGDKGLTYIAKDGNSAVPNHVFQTDAGSGGVERLRITSGGEVVTQGLTGATFDNDGANTKIVEVTGDGTVGEYGQINISGNQNANAGTVGVIKFVNRENSASSSGSNAGSRQLGSIEMRADTGDSNAGDDCGGYFRFITKADGGGNAERLRIKSDGKVGIGIDSPDSLLHVHNGSAGSVTASSSANLTIESSGSYNVLQFLSPSTAAQQIRFGDSSDNGAGWIQYNHNGNVLAFGTAGPEKMRLTSNGTLQMNGGSIQIDGTGEFAVFENDTSLSFNNSAQISLDFSSNVARLRSTANGSGTNRPLALCIGSSEKLRIASNGNVGIGEDNPGSELVVEGTILANNGEIQVDKHIMDGTDDWTATSYQLHYKKTFTNGTWFNIFKFSRSDTAADNNDVGVFGGQLHIVYLNDRSNTVHATGYDVYPFIVRARSSGTVAGSFGSALVDMHEVIGSSVDVRFTNATASQIDMQIYIYNSDGGGSERVCHAWIDGGGASNLSNRFLYAARLT